MNLLNLLKINLIKEFPNITEGELASRLEIAKELIAIKKQKKEKWASCP